MERVNRALREFCMLDLQIRQSQALDQIDQVRQVRYEVLRKPLGLPYEETLFEGDDHPETLHILAYRDSQPIGCLTLMPPQIAQSSMLVQLRGMAVLGQVQGQGVGSQMLTYVADLACRHHWKLWCKARLSAVAFYASNGWYIVGDEFDIPKIGPHYRMEFDPPEQGTAK